ncbi:NUDIX domain-containing protein [Paenibacillus sp. TRM 82003]|nr:NUDIX domain-containing protein [Paenibacillus sp. TRM 82003]
MRLIRKMVHASLPTTTGRTFERRSARGIILNGGDILMMYTERYNDYSFPGGGVEPDEDLLAGLRRELSEEIGARRIEVLQEFGYIDEYRPHPKPEYELIHMLSYFYVCKVEHDFADARLEAYEIANGSKPVWVDLREAIAHNRAVIANREPSMGFSIERETLVLELVAEELA